MSAVTSGLRTEVRKPEPEGHGALGFLWLEITGKCQLACGHCYADSGSWGSHGSMTAADWLRVIDQAAELGVPMVQFIGGEPTLHPNLPAFVERALERGIAVEVFSNLANVTSPLWEAFDQPGVQLATSWYSDDAVEHERITKGRGSYQRTLDGIVEALRRDIQLRVGVIGLADDQRVDEACRQLAELGVTDVGVDHMRAVGRGQSTQQASVEQLCGNCADGVLAISPTGEVWPCVFSRWLPVGNAKEDTLADILNSKALSRTRTELNTAFATRPLTGNCKPGGCHPMCAPNACVPCSPHSNCRPLRRANPLTGMAESTEARACNPGNGWDPASGCAPSWTPLVENCGPEPFTGVRTAELEGGNPARCSPNNGEEDGSCGPTIGCKPRNP